MKETREALLALVLIGKFVSDRVKDGVQLDDALALGQALIADGDFKNIVQAGVADYHLIDDELKDLTLAKALELLQIVPDLVKILNPTPVA